MLKTLRRRLREGWMLVVGIPFAAALVAAALERQGWLSALDDVAYDQALVRFTPKPERSRDLVIAAIDEKTFQTVAGDPALRDTFGHWPYSRNVWAWVHRYLTERGARAVVLDAVMDEPYRDGGDDGLAKVLAASSVPFITGFSANASPQFPALPRADAKNHVGPLPPPPGAAVANADEDKLGDDAEPPPATPAEISQALAFPVVASGVTLPALRTEGGAAHPVPPLSPLLPVVSGFGLVSTEEDSDGKLRRTRFAYSDETNTYVTLPVAAAADLLKADRLELSAGLLRLGERALAINHDGSARIDYGGQLEDRFEVISLAALLADAVRVETGGAPVVPEALLKGKVVLIGGFAVGTWDRKPTPFDSKAPGVVKQAALLDSLLSGRFIVDAPPWASPAFTFLAALLVFTLTFSARWWPVELGILLLGLLAAFTASGLLLARAHVYVPLVPTAVGMGLSTFASMVVSRAFADRDRERMRQMFSHYLSKQVVNQLVEQERLPELSGEDMEVTAFFSDIRGFSTFSEKYKEDPRSLVRILNTYLTRVSAVLLDHGACLDKYIGDAIVCIFGAPVQYPNHAVRACQAALAAQAEVSRIRAEFRAKGLPDVYTRIGLNSAVMFVGNIGSEQLFNYTAIGDGMNLASRLEGANKSYGSAIMLGPRTYELARDFIEARELDRVRVAGKTEAVAVYELLGMKGEISRVQRQVVELYGRALALYRAARFAEAQEPLQEALKLDAEDGPSQALLARCKKLLQHPPPMPFDGVVNLDK